MDRQDSGSHLSESDSESTCVGTEGESLPKKKARKPRKRTFKNIEVNGS